MRHCAVGVPTRIAWANCSALSRRKNWNSKSRRLETRLIYIWGHLSASNDAILPLFGFGPRRFPDLERMFVKNPDRAVTQIISGTELKEIWTQLDVALWEEFQKLSSSDWLQRHQGVSAEDFAREPHRNRYASLLGRTAHLAYHLGQAILAPRNSNRL